MATPPKTAANEPAAATLAAPVATALVAAAVRVGEGVTDAKLVSVVTCAAVVVWLL